MSEQEKQVNPADSAFFFEAETAYAEASKKLMALMKDRWEEQLALAKARDSLKEAEARLLMSGEVNGKNAEERKAQLTNLLAEDPEAIGARNAVRHAETDLAQIEIDIESVRSMRDLMRYRMRYADATLRYLANQESSVETRKQPTYPGLHFTGGER